MAASIVALTFAGVARAQEGGEQPEPTDKIPAVWEYVEDIPTASGRKSTTRPAAKRKQDQEPKQSEQSQARPQPQPAPLALPPRVTKRIKTQPPPVARKLREITTSRGHGAQEQVSPSERRRARALLRDEPDSNVPPGAEALGTAVTVAATGGDARLTLLLLFVLATSLLAIGTATVRAVRRR